VEAKQVSDRIKEIVKKNGYSYNQVARELGISAQAVYRWVNKGGMIRDSNLTDLAAMCNVSPEWIRYGTSGHPESSDSMRVGLMVDKLNDRDRECVEALVRSMLFSK